MAEQSSHNVVELPQSTSGSPLVDAAANTTTASSALGGISAVSNNATGSNSNLINAHHDSQLDSRQPGSAPLSNVTKPSAGNATMPRADDQEVPSMLANEQMHAGKGDLTNGVHDEANHGDHMADDRSISATSDTDTSNTEHLEKKDETAHARTNSVKKPTIFSKVSVTKNFLAKTATTPTPVAAKVGDRPSLVLAGAQPAAKPRLVAKTGTSLQNISKARLSADSSGGPDASKVWNKNQPARPAPPKTFTDEELKQQYGIHLANRLQSDENGKESKWADIDDDEDDWAPEAVTWVDGTKSTLNIQDPVAPVQKEELKDEKDTKDKVEQRPVVAQPVKPAEGVKPTLTSMRRPDQMKILRPGAAANLVKQNGSAATSPASDNASLKTSSPAPVPPTKSPWAQVPKVDTVSPINPPVMQPLAPQRLATQDARAYEPIPPAEPAREIAADTFDRSWREGERGTRELFNSANGRYEPAPEGRRSSVRPDSAFRKPAVLQRTTLGPNGPEQVSSARSGPHADGTTWSRRRTSSVSQGSHPSARRMSITKATDTSAASRDSSTAATRSDQAVPTSNSRSAWDQQMPSRPESAADQGPTEAERLQIQERVMREKRELAIKRRKEEEEREENAKQERLKAKLASLAGAGKSKRDREAEAAAASSSSQVPSAAPKNEPVQSLNMVGAQTTNESPPAINEVVTGEVTQRQPNIEQNADAVSHSLGPSSQTAQISPREDKAQSPLSLPSKPASGISEKNISLDLSAKPASRVQPSPETGIHAPFQQQPPAYKNQPPSYSSSGDRKSQSAFGRSPKIGADSGFSSSPWGNLTSATNNVWSTSGIGNGIFEGSNSYAPLPIGQSSSLPPPPGMTRPVVSSISPQSFSQDQRSQQQASSEPRSDVFGNQTRLNAGTPASGLNRPAHPPGPIAPPSRAQVQSDQAARAPAGTSAWQSLASDLPNQYRANAEIAAEQRKQDAAVKPVENAFRETFKKTTTAQSGQPGGARKYESTEVTLHTNRVAAASSISPSPPNTQTQPSGPFSTPSRGNQTWRTPGDRTVRIPDGSQNPAHGGMPMQPPIGPPSSNVKQAALPSHLKPKAQAQSISNDSSSMLHDGHVPPPEIESHPVFAGNTRRPQVKLPPPQVKVKLPPSAATNHHASFPPAQTGSVMMPQRQLSQFGRPGAATPIVQNGEWQLRFNGLFNRTNVPTETPPSPPRTPPKMQHPALAVASCSRAAMDDYAAVTGGATVSLPASFKLQQPEGYGFVDTGSMSTKPVVDRLFDEERSFGSRPEVSMPRIARYNITEYPASAKNLLRMPINSMFSKPVEAHSIDMLWKLHQSPSGYFVNLPGWQKQKMVPYAPESVQAQRFHGRETSGRIAKARGVRNTSASSPGHNNSGKPSSARNHKSSPYKDHALSPIPAIDGKDAATEARKVKWPKPPRGGSRRSSQRPTPVTSI